MTNFTDKFNTQFQDNFVAHLLRDTQFLETILEDVSPDLFPDENVSRLVRIGIDFYKRHSSAPADMLQQSLDQLKTEGVLSEPQHANLTMLTEDLNSITLQNRRYLLDSFEQFCRVQKYRAELPRISEVLQKGDLDQVDEILSDLLSYRAAKKLSMGRFYSPSEMHLRTERRREDDSSRLFTFIPDLDNVVPGIAPGNINMVQSRMSSDGKTAFLTHLARSFAFQGANVLIFTIGDMTEEEYEDRLDMCFAGLTRAELASDRSVLDAQRRMYRFRSRIHIKEFPASKTTVSNLQDYVARLESASSFYPDVLIVDYADCLGPETQHLRGNLSGIGTEVYGGLKAWMQETGLRMWTAGQSGREASQSSYAEQSHIAGSIEKVRIVDLIVSITRDTQSETKMKLTKTRHSGARGQTFTIPTNFERMQFYDGSKRREV